MTDPKADPMSEQRNPTTSDRTADQTKSDRVTVKRIAERGHYDRDTIDAILDEAIMCHVGTVQDGMPMVIPTLHARDGDHLLIHGSAAAQMLRTAKTQQICVTVTLVDGFVLARSGMHHSMNYRSVCVLGRGAAIEGEPKLEALRVISEQLAPGRWAEGRGPNERELKGTLVVAVDAAEASAKSRTGPPVDDEEDYALPVWAGVLPFATGFEKAQPDPRLGAGIGLPERYR